MNIHPMTRSRQLLLAAGIIAAAGMAATVHAQDNSGFGEDSYNRGMYLGINTGFFSDDDSDGHGNQSRGNDDDDDGDAGDNEDDNGDAGDHEDDDGDAGDHEDDDGDAGDHEDDDGDAGDNEDDDGDAGDNEDDGDEADDDNEDDDGDAGDNEDDDGDAGDNEDDDGDAGDSEDDDGDAGDSEDDDGEADDDEDDGGDAGDSEGDDGDAGDSEDDDGDAGDNEDDNGDAGDSEDDGGDAGDSEDDDGDAGDSEGDGGDAGDSEGDDGDAGDSEGDGGDAGDSEGDDGDAGSNGDGSDSFDDLPDTMRLKGTLRDFVARTDGGHDDFEWRPTDEQGSGSYGQYVNIVQDELDSEGKPVFRNAGQKVIEQWINTRGENIISNKPYIESADGDVPGAMQDVGLAVHDANGFAQWYRDVPGVNLSTTFEITLVHEPGTNKYVFDDKEDPFFISRGGFFPINDELYGNYQSTGKNYHFTYELATDFQYDANVDQYFRFVGDDDVWVFIDNKLVIDLGGIHGVTEQVVDLNRLNWLVDGSVYTLDFFFAERHTTESNFRIETSIRLRDINTPTVSALYD